MWSCNKHAYGYPKGAVLEVFGAIFKNYDIGE
jgi:hypothetical protein